MKCLKNVKTGNIIRVDDRQAYQMAGREWQYVPKSEWKAATRKPKNDQATDQATDQVKVQSKKQLKKQKAEA